MSIDIAEGYYSAKPTCCGLTTTKNGHDQFAIEVAIEVPDGPEGSRVVHMTKFGGLAGDGLEYTVQDAEICGCDTSLDIRQWEVDPTRTVRVRVVIDGEWGPKLKSIFPDGGAGGGVLIKKQAMDEAKKAAVADGVNARIAALRARAGKAAPTKSAPRQQEQLGATGTDDDIPF